MKKINLKITRRQTNDLFMKFFKKRKIIFLAIFGLGLIYSFNMLYNKAYVNINFIEYPPKAELIGAGQNVALEKIADEIEKRKKNFSKMGSKTYRNPFVFQTKGQEGVQKESEEGNIDQSR